MQCLVFLKAFPICEHESLSEKHAMLSHLSHASLAAAGESHPPTSPVIAQTPLCRTYVLRRLQERITVICAHFEAKEETTKQFF